MTAHLSIATPRRLAFLLPLAVLACSSPHSSLDGPDAAVEADASDDGPGSEYIFDDDSLRTYELEIADADWAWLNDNAQLEEYVSGTLLFEGERIGPIGVRYKGGFGNLNSCFDAFGNRTCDKLSIKLKFNEYDKEQRFYKLKKLNFHSMSSDPSALHDRLAYSLYRDMGVKGPRSVHARLIVNGELLGLFALVEQIDGRFSRMNYPDGGEGNVYKEVWPVHATSQPYIDALKTNEDENPDVSPMVRFAAALDNATDDTIENVLAQWTDLDALMAFMAVDRAIDNWDGIVGWWCVGGGCSNHNFYWYQETDRDRLWLIPWDMDNTFDYPNPFVTNFGQPTWDDTSSDCEPVTIFQIGATAIGRRGASCDPLVRWLATTLRPRMLTASERLLDGPLSATEVDRKIDRWEAQIASAVAEDDNGPSVSEWEAAVSEFRANVASLRADTEELVGR